MLGRVLTSSYMAGVALAALAHGGLLAGVFLLGPATTSGLGARDDAFVVTLVAEPAPAPDPVPEQEPEPETDPVPAAGAPPPAQVAEEAPPALTIEKVVDPAPIARPVASEDVQPVEVPVVEAGPDLPVSDAEGAAVLTVDPDPVPANSGSAPPQAPAGAAALNGDGKAMLDAYLRDVRLRLARHAPRSVRGAGNCEVEFRLSRAGEVVFVGIRTSSGSRLYDRRCLSSVTSAVPFPEAPDGARESDRSFTIVMQQKR